MKKFAERLRDLRIDRKLSQNELAKKLGLSNGAVAFWEKEMRVPNALNLITISRFFGVSIDYLVGEED